MRLATTAPSVQSAGRPRAVACPSEGLLAGRSEKSDFDNQPLQAQQRYYAFHVVPNEGAFGIVRLCRLKQTGEVFAMKQMSKKEMVFKNQVDHSPQLDSCQRSIWPVVFRKCSGFRAYGCLTLHTPGCQ